MGRGVSPIFSEGKMSREKELLEKIEGVLSVFTKIQIVAGSAPIIGKVIEALFEAGTYLKNVIEQLEASKEEKKEVDNV